MAELTDVNWVLDTVNTLSEELDFINDAHRTFCLEPLREIAARVNPDEDVWLDTLRDYLGRDLDVAIEDMRGCGDRSHAREEILAETLRAAKSLLPEYANQVTPY